MEKKLTKSEKGITLVALIITIIILLILAVVSIRAITGDNILGKSEKAKEKYESAKSNEVDILKDYSNNIGEETLTIEVGKEYIDEEAKLKIKFIEPNKVSIYYAYEGEITWNCLYQIKEKIEYNGEKYFVIYVKTEDMGENDNYQPMMLIKADKTLIKWTIEYLNTKELDTYYFIDCMLQ